MPASAAHPKRLIRAEKGARWTVGFWAQRSRTCSESVVPTMGRLMTDPERERVKFLGNFIVASGAEPGRHRGPRWNDGDFYKWIEAASSLLAAERDTALEAELDEYIGTIARAQRPDGYIHTDIQIRQRAGEKVEPFDNPMDFEMYNMGHLMSAGCRHFEATGKRSLLDVALKSATFLRHVFADPQPGQARHGICPSHLMGLCDLYRTTGDHAHIDLAVKLLEMRNLVAKGDDDNQDRVPFREHDVAHGHAVRATYLYAGMADIYLETGDESLLPALTRVWGDLVSRKLYITGGCGALFDGASPDGTADQLNITRVHQSFGRNYQLPQSTAHNETCAAIGNVLWSWRMFQITGEAKYVDVVEHTLFNSVLAGVSLDGTKFFYTNTLRQLNPMPVELRWNRRREAVMGCWCCPPNVARTLAQTNEYAYATDAQGGVYVLLYGGSELRLDRIALRQETDYPWDGRVRIEVIDSDERERSLFLRIPAWASRSTGYHAVSERSERQREAHAAHLENGLVARATGEGVAVKINGASLEATVLRTGFVEIRRAWQAGDLIELNLPMEPRFVEANPLVEEARNHLAIQRGPIVYCLESTDLPAGVRLMDVTIRADHPLAARRDDLLGGIVTIGAKGRAREPVNWSGVLYRDYAPGPAREIDLMLIPYYTWDNRGESEMTVWIPLSA